MSMGKLPPLTNQPFVRGSPLKAMPRSPLAPQHIENGNGAFATMDARIKKVMSTHSMSQKAMKTETDKHERRSTMEIMNPEDAEEMPEEGDYGLAPGSEVLSMSPSQKSIPHSHSIKVFHPPKFHPINATDLLLNTHKSPFQQSVRDKSNFYFRNAAELESLFDLKKAVNKTYNRRLKVKNSYLTLFPMYGIND